MNITKVQQFLQKDITQVMSALQADSKPQWGNMEAQEMIEHLAMAVKGGHTLEFGADKEPKPIQEQAKITFLEQDAPYPKGIPSPFHKNGKPALMYANLEDAKQNLVKQIRLMYAFFEIPENQAKFFYHPFFGKLDFEGVQKFNYKHIEHHFKQFGLL